MELDKSFYCIYCKRFRKKPGRCVVAGEPYYNTKRDEVTGEVEYAYNTSRLFTPSYVKDFDRCVPLPTLRGKYRIKRGLPVASPLVKDNLSENE